jgi:hypothetical protein
MKRTGQVTVVTGSARASGLGGSKPPAAPATRSCNPCLHDCGRGTCRHGSHLRTIAQTTLPLAFRYDPQYALRLSMIISPRPLISSGPAS